MDKNAIRKYAVWARTELISRVSQRALLYGITEKEMTDNLDSVNGKLLTPKERKQRSALIAKIQQYSYEHIIDEVAYTWFNRFCALRFMEVNGYLPSHVRVFTDENNAFNPQIITEAIHLDIPGLDMNMVYELKEKNDTEELYKYLLIVQCNALYEILPGMFQKIEDYTELLFPDNLLREGSIVEQLVSVIPEDDWKDAVQIIGWLYQFYISVRKDEVFASKKTITKDTLPAVTQLFTPDWIVRYMTENSIGRIWMESYPDSPLKTEMKYYVPEAEQCEEVRRKIDAVKYRDVNPEELRIIEPCCGSGHILVYAFDLLYKIYLEKGYQAREIPTLILQKNLVGLEIDKRAAQLSYFSLMMKARSVNARFFSERYYAAPKVFEIVSSELLIHLNFMQALKGMNILSSPVLQEIDYLVDIFRYAKTIGSLLKVKKLNFDALDEALVKLEEKCCADLFHASVLAEGLPVLKQMGEQAKAMSAKYDVMITNPPYIGISTMEGPVKDYAIKNYPNSKTDMFAMFMETEFVKSNGFFAMINMHSWMFLSSYENLRKSILMTKEIITMAHLGARAFEAIGGEVVQTTTFVIRNGNFGGNGVYFRLVDSVNKEQDFVNSVHGGGVRHIVSAAVFSSIPGKPIAYWLTQNFYKIFKNATLENYADARIGMVSGDNDRFLRLWYEVDFTKSYYTATDAIQAVYTGKKWFPLQKGGGKRYWYGNLEYVINYERDGYELKFCNSVGDRIRSHNYNGPKAFMSGITWNSIGTKDIICRFSTKGYLYDAGGPLCTINVEEDTYYFLGLLSSTIARNVYQCINPTINFTPGTLLSLPIVLPKAEIKSVIKTLVGVNVEKSKEDWDSFEESWDFKKHPLI